MLGAWSWRTLPNSKSLGPTLASNTAGKGIQQSNQQVNMQWKKTEGAATNKPSSSLVSQGSPGVSEDPPPPPPVYPQPIFLPPAFPFPSIFLTNLHTIQDKFIVKWFFFSSLGQNEQHWSAKIPEFIILLPSVIWAFSFLLAEANTLGDIFQHYSQTVHF